MGLRSSRTLRPEGVGPEVPQVGTNCRHSVGTVLLAGTFRRTQDTPIGQIGLRHCVQLDRSVAATQVGMSREVGGR